MSPNCISYHLPYWFCGRHSMPTTAATSQRERCVPCVCVCCLSAEMPSTFLSGFHLPLLLPFLSLTRLFAPFPSPPAAYLSPAHFLCFCWTHFGAVGVGYPEPPTMSAESQRVVYGATFDIPYAIGSVSVPLDALAASSPPRVVPQEVNKAGPSPSSSCRRGLSSGNISSVRRCTHHRYCYVRDGGDLSQDAFYRWLEQQQQKHREGVHASSTSSPPNEDPGRPLTPTMGITSTNATSSALPDAPTSPSLFYASVKCVVFVLPNSFPHPRRVLRHPPFIIEDDTWAEHLVEVQLYFWPHLKIPPATVVHQALLERRLSLGPSTQPSGAVSAAAPAEDVREVWVPQLLASTYGKPKLLSVATNVTVRVPAHHATATAPDTTKAASRMVVVAEKVDTLHLYHPSLDVVRHIRAVLAMSRLPVLEAVREAFDAAYSTPPPMNANGSSHSATSSTLTDVEVTPGVAVDTSLSTPFAHSWSLPFEDTIAEYAEQRASTSVAVLQAVLEKLKRERQEMEKSCEGSMEQIVELATVALPTQLQRVHTRCMKLYRKE
ncbi:putative YEATS family [Leishmania utingensis]|uniref:YEATS family n=1 Tax=Leishmania utingensis TaxID=653362 RepID=A0AAW2ZYD5_9TRYP